MWSNCRMHAWSRFAIVATVTAFAISGYALAADTARIDPRGKVSVYRVDKKVDELSAEAPLPYDLLLKTIQQCAVRMNALYFIAADKSAFSVTAPPQDNLIEFVNGNFYFSLTELPRQLVIKTPIEDVTVQQVLFQAAATGGKLDGYIFVEGDTTEIGVLEGGSLVLTSSHGEHVLPPGNRIIIAQAGGHPEMADGVNPGEDDDDNIKTIVIGGAVGAAAIAATVYALSSDDDDDNPPQVSPSSP